MRYQRFIKLIIRFIAVEIGDLRPMAGIMNVDRIQWAGLTDELIERGEHPVSGRLLIGEQATTLLAEREGASWLDVAGFAGYVGQTMAKDEATSTWYFGPGPEERRGQLEMLDAPDFELPDLDGRMHKLSDHRGKKVLLALWASW